MTKKLLITTDCFLPRWDGIARVLYEIIPHLKNWDITVVAPQFPGEIPKLPISLVQVPITRWMIGDIYPALPKMAPLQQLIRDSDVVFNHTAGPIGLASIYLASKNKKPIVTYIHSLDWLLFSKSVKYGKWFIYHITKIVERIAYNQTSMIMTPSGEVSDIMSLNSIRTPSKVVPLGVNTSVFVPPKNKDKAKQALNIPSSSIVIGYVGRISREKDLKTLKRAFNKVLVAEPSARLLIVGSGVPKEAEDLRGRKIIMVGSQKDVVPYLQAMDIFVLPSLTETTSLSTLEAMACCLPVVVTRVGNIKVYVHHGKNGLFFRRKSPRRLAFQLKKLIRDPGLRESMGINARKTALKFDWENSAKKMDAILRSLVR